MTKRARIARNVGAAVGQVVASGLIMLVLYGSILRILGEQRLGIWSVLLASASVARIGELGLAVGVTRFVAKYRALGDDAAAGDAVQTAALTTAVLYGLIAAAIYPVLLAFLDRLFPPSALDDARAILPYALASLGLSAVAGVFQSALDGCQRYDYRSSLVVSGQLLFLAATLSLAPRYGLMGLALAQMLQGVAVLIAGWVLLRRVLHGLPWAPTGWKRRSLQEVLGYGLKVQLGAVAMMLFEPLSKILLGKYGGLATAAYFEMASQYVSKARALIVSANQVLVPVAAELNETRPGRVVELYEANVRILLFAAFPLFALVAVWGPLLSEIWIGVYEPRFVLFVCVLSLAQCLNAFAGPAYFSNLGTGHVGANTTTHIFMGITNATLGIVLGPLFGAAGIAWGLATSIVLGSAYVITTFHIRRRVPWRALLPNESSLLLVACIVAVAGDFAAYEALRHSNAGVRFAVCLLLPLVIVIPALWGHPLRGKLFASKSLREAAKRLLFAEQDEFLK